MEMVTDSSNLLYLLLAAPVVSLLLLCIVPASAGNVARIVGGVGTAVALVISLVIVNQFDPSVDGFQFASQYDWLPELGVGFFLGIDGISLWFLPLTALLTLLVIISSVSISKHPRAYIANLMLLQVGMLGTFLALDVLSFYVFWELMLVPMYFLIGVWGGARRIYAALKFFIYTALGSLLMLVAIIYVANTSLEQTGNLSFFLGDWLTLSLSFKEQMWLFLAFALAFSIKIPLFPLHTWLPDAHVEAPTGGSVILAGILLKMGLYGLIRFCMPLFPEAVVWAAPFFVVLGVAGIIYGALVAWVQTDVKKLVAYSSVSHLGFCVLGFASMTEEGLQGSVLQMISHGVSTGALFFLVGVLYDRKHTREISAYSGLAQKVPVFAFVFLVFTLSSIGLPLTNGFVGEFLIMLGAYRFSPIATMFAVTGVILGAMYMLSLYRRMIFGSFDAEKNGDLTDLNSREILVFSPLFVLVFFIGLFPNVFLNPIALASSSSLRHLDGGVVANASAHFGSNNDIREAREVDSEWFWQLAGGGAGPAPMPVAQGDDCLPAQPMPGRNAPGNDFGAAWFDALKQGTF